MMPRRIQRQRTAGWRAPADAVYVGRPTKWGNPWRIVPVTAPGCAEWADILHVEGDRSLGRVRLRPGSGAGAAYWATRGYGLHLQEHPELVQQARAELAGRDLMCWCAPDQPCHADILLAVAAGEPWAGAIPKAVHTVDDGPGRDQLEGRIRMTESDEQPAAKPLSRAARRRQVLMSLQESIGQTHKRIADAVADALAALDVKAARLAEAQAADDTAGVAVRLMVAEGLTVDRVVGLLGGAVTVQDVQRYAAVNVVAAQEAVESDRVPYAERTAAPRDDDAMGAETGEQET